jgi:hypothetical protein
MSKLIGTEIISQKYTQFEFAIYNLQWAKTTDGG